MPNDAWAAPQPVSPDRALIWLRQQHQPDVALADIGLWRLDGAMPPGRIAAAWGRVWADHPDLRLSFDLDDSGAVVAQACGHGLAPLHLLHTDSAEATEQALRAAWAGTGGGLVAMALGLHPTGTTLALLRHHLLADAVSLDGLIARLCAALDGRAHCGMSHDPLPHWLRPLDPGAAGSDQLTDVILAALREALGLPDLGPQDDFFDHGGHSLLATRVIGRLLDQHGIEIAFDDIFAHATAARLALRARTTAPPPLAQPDLAQPAAPQDFAKAPLSLAQQSLWKASAAHGHGAVFNLPFVLRFLAPVDEAVFAAAFRDLMIRHPVLRSLFIPTGDEVTQHVVPQPALDSYRWWWHSDDAGQASLATEAAHAFDLARELPVRLRFFRDKDGQALSFLFHHIVLDEWSLSQLMAELGQAYAARASGRAPDWPNSPPPFHLFAQDQRQAADTAAHLAWWMDHLRDLPALPLPLPGRASAPAGAEARGLLRLDLDPTLAEGLRRAARRLDASLFNLFHAAIAAAMHAIAGMDRLAVGTSASGRQAARWFDTVGYFTTVVCHNMRLDPQMTLTDLVAQSRDLVARSLPHSDVPIDLVEEALPGGPPPPGTHVFEVFIQIHAGNALNGALHGPAGPIPYRQIEIGTPPSILPLHVEVMEDVTTPGRDLHLTLNHCARRFDAAQGRAILARMHRVLARIATPEGAALRLADLNVATADTHSPT
ncbi:condensation domain-containing protein [Paracoccus sp. p4-l81]|uniref:condensation domain-containing protein n=1 Tax=Paracoccus sp. p4-l81 TaxID=3342806 RepID=UPI0035B96C54